MIVCVHGISFENFGSMMMLNAVRRFLAREIPESLVCVPYTSGTVRERRSAGVDTGLFTHRLRYGVLPVGGAIPDRVAAWLPGRLRRRHGLILLDDVNLHLDASGFAYGDVWGPNRPRRMEELARRWVDTGARLILLPQAFGSFLRRDVRLATKKYLDYAARIFARDSDSMNWLEKIDVRSDTLRSAPDLTLAEKEDRVEKDAAVVGAILVVPNVRMVDRGGIEQSQYLGLLSDVIGRIAEHGVRPVIMIHEKYDTVLAHRLSAVSRTDIVVPGDWREARRMVGSCLGLVSSRYHALASALAHGRPCMAIGWSHKYWSLLSDFGIPDMAFAVDDGRKILEGVDHMLGHREELRAEIASRIPGVVEKVSSMWRDVRDEIYRPTGGAAAER